MSTIPTSRRGTAAVFIAVMFVSAACGSKTEVTDVGGASVNDAVVRAPFMPSADNAERHAQQLQQGHPPISADNAERQGMKLQLRRTRNSTDATDGQFKLDPRVRD